MIVPILPHASRSRRTANVREYEARLGDSDYSKSMNCLSTNDIVILR